MRSEHAAVGTTRVVRTGVVVIAGHRDTGDARGLLAGVTQGARIAVRTVERVRKILAPCALIAGVVRAEIVIGALQGLADAHSGDAVVSLGAGVPIETLAGLKVHVLAAALSQAGILGAWVPIVAGRVIDEAVAIVIDAVADLGRWDRGGARAQPILVADARALTAAVLVRLNTGGGQGRVRGQNRAVAQPFVEDALVALSSVDGLHLVAAVCVWARSLKVTGSAAEAAAAFVSNTRVGRVTHATLRGLAGQTERAKLRHAHVLAIRSGAHERAAPSRGTQLVARLRADLVAHVRRADTREAI
jgi:hypothetical protein